MQVLWFRRDLRLDDHPALIEACGRGVVLPLFILDPHLLLHPETAPARVAFMLACLRALDADLRRRGSWLLVRRGEPAAVLMALVREMGAAGVVAHVDSERLVGRVRDGRVGRALAAAGIPLRWVEPPGACPDLLAYPHYRRFWHGQMALDPLSAPSRIATPPPLHGDRAAADGPLPDLAELGLRGDGKPIPPAGTAAALERLQQFCAGGAADRYFWQLSQPSARITTGLGPYLKFGVVSHRRVLHSIAALRQGSGGERRSWRQLVSRLRWGAGMAQRFRHLPQLELSPLWQCYGSSTLSAEQEELYAAWQSGHTGFPIVDATSRCLLAGGGWLDLNFRSRAIHASFLTNLCGIDWRYGALHYMRHLIDGDCCIDHYQWAMQAGVTAPGGGRGGGWSRIYHPGQVAVDRCDPQGVFIRRWLPELAALTNDQLGSPPAMAAYPRPLLDYDRARRRCLARLTAQRQQWRPHGFSPLPADLTPFAAERIEGSAVDWARQHAPQLYPAALPLEQLDGPALRDLASWFGPSRSLQSRTPQAPARRPPSSGRRRSAGADGSIQLELWS